MPKMKKEPKPCAAREPLLHGSRACPRPRESSSDLCAEHQKLLGRHQLIDGTLYVERSDEETPDGDGYVFEALVGEARDGRGRSRWPHYLTMTISDRQTIADLIQQAARCLADGRPLTWSMLGKMDKEKGK